MFSNSFYYLFFILFYKKLNPLKKKKPKKTIKPHAKLGNKHLNLTNERDNHIDSFHYIVPYTGYYPI